VKAVVGDEARTVVLQLLDHGVVRQRFLLNVLGVTAG
jgi:hypothetical protein